jgi:hypothetical protein
VDTPLPDYQGDGLSNRVADEITRDLFFFFTLLRASQEVIPRVRSTAAFVATQRVPNGRVCSFMRCPSLSRLFSP